MKLITKPNYKVEGVAIYVSRLPQFTLTTNVNNYIENVFFIEINNLEVNLDVRHRLQTTSHWF